MAAEVYTIAGGSLYKSRRKSIHKRALGAIAPGALRKARRETLSGSTRSGDARRDIRGGDARRDMRIGSTRSGDARRDIRGGALAAGTRGGIYAAEHSQLGLAAGDAAEHSQREHSRRDMERDTQRAKE